MTKGKHKNHHTHPKDTEERKLLDETYGNANNPNELRAELGMPDLSDNQAWSMLHESAQAEAIFAERQRQKAEAERKQAQDRLAQQSRQIQNSTSSNSDNGWLRDELSNERFKRRVYENLLTPYTYGNLSTVSSYLEKEKLKKELKEEILEEKKRKLRELEDERRLKAEERKLLALERLEERKRKAEEKKMRREEANWTKIDNDWLRPEGEHKRRSKSKKKNGKKTKKGKK